CPVNAWLRIACVSAQRLRARKPEWRTTIPSRSWDRLGEICVRRRSTQLLPTRQKERERKSVPRLQIDDAGTVPREYCQTLMTPCAGCYAKTNAYDNRFLLWSALKDVLVKQ